MEDLNPQVVAWLADGKIREVLLGEPPCFLSDHGYPGRHDFGLAMSVFLRWANLDDNWSVGARALKETLEHAAVDSPQRCADALLAYAIRARFVKPRLPLDYEPIILALRRQSGVANHQLSATEATLRELK